MCLLPSFAGGCRPLLQRSAAALRSNLLPLLFPLLPTGGGRALLEWSAAAGGGGGGGEPHPPLHAQQVRRQVLVYSSRWLRSAGECLASKAGKPLRAVRACAHACIYAPLRPQSQPCIPTVLQKTLFTLILPNCRDLTIPPVGTATGAHVAVAGLREAVSQLEVPTPGEACAIRRVCFFASFLSVLPAGWESWQCSRGTVVPAQLMYPASVTLP